MEKKVQANGATPTDTTPSEAIYQDAVRKGRDAIAVISDKQWILGDLALQVSKVYGENRLERFAEDINFPGAACTLGRYRSVCSAFPKTGGRPRFFASAQVLQTHPDCLEIVKRNPAISKAAAREEMRKWRAEQNGTASSDDVDADADDDLDETDNDTEPTETTETDTKPPATSTPAKAKETAE
jgi:hypothetical protein